MSDVTVTVDDAGMEAVIRVFGVDFVRLAKEALYEAYILGGVQQDIWRATPMSQRAKYAERLGNKKGTRLMNKDGTGLVRGWRGKVTEEEADWLDSVGMGRLRNSLFIQGENTSLDDLGFRQIPGGVEFRLQSSVPYAGRMHETDKPAKGEYWTPGNGGFGWSTPGTGAKYIEDNVDAQKMAEAMARCVMAKVRS
jgi:hypothetical protein